MKTTMHKPSLLRNLEKDCSDPIEKEEPERQDRLAKVLMFHSKGYSQAEIAGKPTSISQQSAETWLK